MTFAISLTLVAAIALVALAAGRLFVAGFGTSLFRRFDAAGAAAALPLGSALLVLATIWLSAAGLRAPAMLPLLPALALAPLASAWRRGRLGALRPSGPGRQWLSLVLPVAAAAVIASLPLLRTNGYAVGNDTFTYSAFSEWLQHHGFAEECRWLADSPVTGIPALWQHLQYDLGIAHWLALVQAATAAPSALLVYPATAAFGMALVAAALWLVARQVLRLGPPAAAAATVVFAVVPHALYWGHHNGFLQQTYALALVLLGLVLFARAATPRRWTAGTAALVALPMSFLVAVYVPLLPTFLIAAVPAGTAAFVGARRLGAPARVERRRRFAAFAVMVGVFALGFALRDVVGLIVRLRAFATDVGGGHVPGHALHFFQFAVGVRVVAPGWESVESGPWTALNRALAPGYVALVLLGLWRAWATPRRRSLAAAASVLLVGIGYYAAAVDDPWSGRLGHTWNVFKLAQWATPFLLLLAVLGLQRLAASWPRGKGRAILVASACALPLTLVGDHWTWSRQLGLTMQEVLPGPRPLRDLPRLKRRILELPAGTLLLVGKPSSAGRWLGAITALLAYPRAIAGDWAESASIGNADGGEALYHALLSRSGEPHVVGLLAGFLPFQTDGTEPLSAGYARLLPSDRPVIVHVLNPAGFQTDERSARLPSFTLDERRTKIVVFSPAPLAADRTVTLGSGEAAAEGHLLFYQTEGDYNHRSVRLATQGPPKLSIPVGNATPLRIPAHLPRGLSTLVLVLSRPEGKMAARPLRVAGLRLTRSAESGDRAARQGARPGGSSLRPRAAGL